MPEMMDGIILKIVGTACRFAFVGYFYLYSLKSTGAFFGGAKVLIG